MAPQVGLESTRKPKFNNIQDHGWHRSTRKAVVGRQTDCKWIAWDHALKHREAPQENYAIAGRRPAFLVCTGPLLAKNAREWESTECCPVASDAGHPPKTSEARKLERVNQFCATP